MYTLIELSELMKQKGKRVLKMKKKTWNKTDNHKLTYAEWRQKTKGTPMSLGLIL